MGLRQGEIELRVANRRLRVVHPGVYAVGHEALSAHGLWMAAVIAYGDALLSYRSAAALWSLRETARSAIDVTVPGCSYGRRPGIHVHRARNLRHEDRVVRDGIPVTSLPRTLLDLADVISPANLEQTLEAADRARLLDLDALRELLEQSPGRRGRRLLYSLIANYTPAPDVKSTLERGFLRFCDEWGIPRPRTNVVVEGFEVDCHWPGSNLVVELDSWSYHRGRRAFEADRERDEVFQVAGHRILRVTHRRLSAAQATLARDIQALLAAPAHRLAAIDQRSDGRSLPPSLGG
jgi:hypothetical protein